MRAQLLDGTRIAAQIRDEVKAKLAAAPKGVAKPGLGVLLVGDDPASAVYVRSKVRACEEVGLHHETQHLPAGASTAEVAERVDDFNRRGDIHGILVQLPLPPQVDTVAILDRVREDKDVDGFHPANVGRLVQKRPRFVPCTPAGIMELLRRSHVPLSGRRAAVVGRSDIVGKPMALLLLHADATVTLAHSRTPDLGSVLREADLVVAAAGRAGLVRAEHLKPGAVVVDVGMNRVSDRDQARELLARERWPEFERRGYALVGDVHQPSVAEVASALTPVPGGVGPLTIAMLIANTVKAASL